MKTCDNCDKTTDTLNGVLVEGADDGDRVEHWCPDCVTADANERALYATD